MFVSYAQNFEDVMLWRALGHIQNGFYIDIGANDPEHESVSCSFYHKGWRGINVEPVSRLIERLKAARKEDVNIQACVGSGGQDVPFYLLESEGMSSADPEIIELYKKQGRAGETMMVKTISLAELLEQSGEKEIHWLKIDAEGMEEEIVKSWGSHPKRPWVLVVESTIPGTKTLNHFGFEPLLLEMGYEFVYFDGINRFYVHETQNDLKPQFAYPPCIFDKFTLSETNHSFGTALIEKNQTYLTMINTRNKELVGFNAQINELKFAVKTISATLDRMGLIIENRARLKK